MAWFGKAENPVSVSSVNAGWVRAASTRNLITQWSEIMLRLQEILSGNVLYYPEQQNVLLNQIDVIRKEWMLVDRQLITDDEAGLLYRIINQDAPEMIQRLGQMKAERASTSANHEGNYLEVSERVRKVLGEVSQLRTKTDAQKLARYTESTNGTVEQHLASLAFPIYADLPTEFDEQLQNMRELWESLQSEVHSVEDEYLLERIVTDYLPNSVELYLSFLKGPERLRQQAKEAFLSQLSLLFGRLEAVQEAALVQKMKAMNAQSQFLEERLGNEGTL
jgi:hypothetical protein